MIGQTISHYRILEKIGAGGMGVVYKAQDLKLQRTVALKFLPADLALHPRDKENLIREARAASALDNANIGAIYGLEEGPDHHPFIIMAHYEGQTLAQLLSRGLVSLPESLDLLLQIARGLTAAHARNIVHRDVKPTNIIVTQDQVAKIVDFGLARVVANSSATQTMQTSGTLPYMAPEQVLGEPISPACDVWAFGVILIQMLTGIHPFFRENAAAMTFAILNQPPSSVDSLPPSLRPVAFKALSKQAEHRYPTAKELLSDLEAARAQIFPTGSIAGPNDLTQTNMVSDRALKKFAEHASTPRWSTGATQSPSRPIGVYLSLAAVGLALLSLAVPQVRERLAALLSTGRENHIAVLPFDNPGNDPATEAVAQGLVDSMTSELSNLSSAQQSLWVVPASVVRGRKITDPSAAAHELGATMVVKGTIQRNGRAVHLTVDLIDAKNLRQIGSVSLDDQAGDIAVLQHEAVSRMARLMNIKVTAEMLRTTGGTVLPAAYESYLEALGRMQRYDKPENLDRAIAALKAAVNTDPRFALGYAELGEAFRLKYQRELNPKWLEEAKSNCQKAVELDDRLSVAFETLGRIHELAGNHDLAVQEFHRALSLDPQSANALQGIAHSYESAGKIQEAEATYKQAAALNADNWDAVEELGLFYDRQAKYPQAIEQLRRVVKLTPDNSQAFSNLGAIYLDTSDPKLRPDAEVALNKSIELNPTYFAYANLGALYYDEKRYAEAASTFEKALQKNSENYLVWESLMNCYKWLGQKEKATAALEKAFALATREAELKPRDAMAQAVIASLCAEKNLREKALGHLQTSLILSPEDPDVLEDAAGTYEHLGDRAHAIEYAEKALQKGYAQERMKNDPDLRGVLSDPNFRATGR
jgi:serine/threonine protein kinase/tetratricopeptide (TPR) repeat protein